MGTALIQAGIAVETDATALDAFSNALNAEGGFSATEDTALAQQVAPQDDMISGSTFATKAMTGSLQGIMSNRMAALRSGDAYYGSGMSAGSLSANSGFLQVFGTDVEQKNKTVGSGTQFGYDASSAGIALGFDGITDNGTVVGLSLSTSETDVDGKGTGNSKNDIDSYTTSIYMDKSTDAGYVEGSLTLGFKRKQHLE
jgi:outer membrane autotransporter protein